MAERTPTVSVLMSARNCGKFLQEAVDSILRQSFDDLELLIVDDGSTDNTWAVLNGLTDPRVTLFRNADNLGAAESKNRLLAHARGEFIAIMDGDDTCAPDRLERQVAYLRANPGVGVLGTYYLLMTADGRDIGMVGMPIDNATIKAGMLHLRASVLHGSSMLRRRVLQQVGGYRPAIGIAEDIDLWLRLRDVCEFHNLPVALYRWRMHPNQTGTRVMEEQASSLMLRLYAVERDVVGSDSLDTMSETDRARIRAGAFILPRVGNVRQKRQIMAVLGASTVSAARPIQAYRLASAAIRTWPLSPVGYGIALRCFFSMQTYARTLRRCKNACGRFVYRVLRVKP